MYVNGSDPTVGTGPYWSFQMLWSRWLWQAERFFFLISFLTLGDMAGRDYLTLTVEYGKDRKNFFMYLVGIEESLSVNHCTRGESQSFKLVKKFIPWLLDTLSVAVFSFFSAFWGLLCGCAGIFCSDLGGCTCGWNILFHGQHEQSCSASTIQSSFFPSFLLTFREKYVFVCSVTNREGPCFLPTSWLLPVFLLCIFQTTIVAW